MSRLTRRAFLIITLIIVAHLASAPQLMAAQYYRYFEYFEGLPEDYIEAGWTGYNFHPREPIGNGAELTLYGYPKTIDGRIYTCTGWEKGSGNIPAEGDVNHVNFKISSDSSITWIYKEAHQVTFQVDATDQSLWAWGDYNPLHMVQEGSIWINLSAGQQHTLGIKQDGTLWAWGGNWAGQLGLGNIENKSSPTQVDPDTQWAAVAAGGNHSVAIRSDGTFWSWGLNWDGQLGLGTVPNGSTTPTQVGRDDKWVAVAAGESHTIALKQDGTLWAWGSNQDGQLGLGNTLDWHLNPDTGHWYVLTPPSTWQDVEDYAVSMGGHLVTINDANENTWLVELFPEEIGSLWIGLTYEAQEGIWKWTSGEYLIPGAYDNWEDNEPSHNSDQSHAVMWGGHMGKWDDQAGTHRGIIEHSFALVKEPAVDHGPWINVVAGYSHTVALKEDGTLWAWGNNQYGQLGIGKIEQSRANPTQVVVGPPATWKAVAAGGWHTVAIRSDDTLWAWGINSYGQLGSLVTEPEPGWIRNPDNYCEYKLTPSSTWQEAEDCAVSMGAHLVTINNEDENAWLTLTFPEESEDLWIGLYQDLQDLNYSEPDGGWKWVSGEMPWFVNWNPFEPNDSKGGGTSNHATMFKDHSGKWNDDFGNWQNFRGIMERSIRPAPTQVKEPDGDHGPWVALAAGESHTIALKQDGTLWAWGRNDNGQLGLWALESLHLNSTTGHEYALTPALPWEEAEAYAVSWGGHLVTINDDKENTWLVEKFPEESEDLWIGLHQIPNASEPDGDWHWASGDSVSSDSWYPWYSGQPDDFGGDQDYAVMWVGQQGMWDDQGETIFHRGIMERPATQWVAVAAGAHHTIAIQGPNRFDLKPHAGPRFIPEGEEIAASAKVIPTDGAGVYNLTDLTSDPVIYGASFTVEEDQKITWIYEEALTVTVKFAQGVPVSVRNGAGAFPEEGENRFVIGSDLRLQVNSVVTDPDTGTVYVCTGWTGTGDLDDPNTFVTDPNTGRVYVCTGWTGTGDPGDSNTCDSVSEQCIVDPNTFEGKCSGSGTIIITIPSLANETTITWNFAEARSLTTKFDGLPEHLQVDEQFDPRGANKGWDPQEPVWLPVDSSQDLTPPAAIYDQGGRVKYVLDVQDSYGDGDLPEVGKLDNDSDGKPDTFSVTQDSTVTWKYSKKVRLIVDVAGLDDPDDAEAEHFKTTYHELNSFVTVSAKSEIDDNEDNNVDATCRDLVVISGSIGDAPLSDDGQRKQVTFLFTEPTKLVWNYQDAERWVLGQAIDPPSGWSDDPDPNGPTLDQEMLKDNAFYWDKNTLTLYPVQPFASATIDWTNTNTTGYAVWPSDATLWAWGDNQDGQLGLAPNIDTNSPTQVNTDTNWVTFTAGEGHTIALTQDGSLWAWGDNTNGQLGLGGIASTNSPTQVDPNTEWVAVAAGASHTVAIGSDGTLWAWGDNQDGQLGLGNTIDTNNPTQVGTDTDWAAVTAGQAHTVAIRLDGTLWAWGDNQEGQLGLGHTIDTNSPTQVGTDTDWAAVTSGQSHTVAIRSDGTLWAWGDNQEGQLGLGNTIDTNSPIQVGTDTDWICVAAGASHTIAVKSGGTLWAWGKNMSGQLGFQTPDADNDGYMDHACTPRRIGTNIYWSFVAAGASHTLAMKSTLQKHVVGTPANLRPLEDSINKFEEMHYSEAYGYLVGPTSENPVFNPPGSGKSLLRFSTGDSNPPLFVVVQSVDWETMLWTNEQGQDTPCTIGVEIEPPNDLTHADPEGKNGYVFFEKSYCDGSGDNKAYDRARREGQIIPVNKTNAETPTNRQMVVVWYETGATGIGWPVKPVRYLCQWPEDPERIIIAGGNGSEPLLETEYMGKIYYQPDRQQPGYNPNEEHALLLGNKIFALRNDLNTYQDSNSTWIGPGGNDQNLQETSEPYVLLKYWDPEAELWAMKVFKMEATGTDMQGDNHQFSYPIDAGKPIIPLTPIDLLPKMPESKIKEDNEGNKIGGEWHHQDHKGGHWAKASNGLTNDPNQSTIIMHWYYPLQSGFYYPFRKKDGSPVGVGDPVPFLNGGNSHQDAPRDVAYVVNWPEDVAVLNIGETLTEAKYGLPDILNWAAGQVIFDKNIYNGGSSLATLFDPYTERSFPLPTLPDGLRTENVEGKLRFPDLPYTLRSRLFYDPLMEKLIFKGISYDPGIGEPLLLPNIMTVLEKDRLQNFEPYWRNAIEGLFWETRNYIAGSQKLIGVPMAMTAGAAGGEGYIVLAENDDQSLEAAPVALHVIRVAGGPYRGEIKVIKPDDVFDEKLTLRHSGDFGGQPEKLYFAWYYKPDNSGLPPLLPEDAADTEGWVLFDEGPGMIDITIEGAGKLTLSDNWFMAHYYYGVQPGDMRIGYPALCSQPESPLGPLYWSDWAGAPGAQTAQLAPGWIKRVVSDLNPLDARVKDFRNYAVSTDVSMVTQLGQRYEGDIALSGTPENLNTLGLIEAYETILDQARIFSIDAAPPADYGPANNAILNAGTRIADFYTLLGNEAYADAQDPTIGFDSQSGALGTMASSIFAFQNQLSSLLEEELVLLRGRDDTMSTTRARPVYNRLTWNFTQGDGESAYVQTYNITDKDTSGIMDELDAKVMYPQGHGDAWGHYLTAMKVWYRLLKHDFFTWEPRIESVLVGGAPIPVDYLDERKFAQTASAKARAGAEIVNLTYRRSYVEDPAGQWQGYKDTEEKRAWGVDGWARRAAQGAYFDWAVANAMLPEKDPVPTHTGIRKIDRSTVPELASITSEFQAIQSQADLADQGLNPLGLAKGVVPFDIDPSLLTPYPGQEVKTHFEQVYDRALGALENARTVFDYATQYTLMLRGNEDSLITFTRRVQDQERDYLNRLIEIFGYPYGGDIGPGGTYKAGYNGPDLFHFMYVDLPDLTGEPLMGEQVAYTYTFDFSTKSGVFDTDGDFLLKGLNVTTKTDPETGQITPSGEITYHINEDSPWMSKRSGWDKRRAPGELQMALSDLIKAHASYMSGLTDLEGMVGVIQAAVDILEAKHGVMAHQISVLNYRNKTIADFEDKIKSKNKKMLRIRHDAEWLAMVADNLSLLSDVYEMEVEIKTGIPPEFSWKNKFDPVAIVRHIVAGALDLTAQSILENSISLEHDILGYEFDIEREYRNTEKYLLIDDARFEVQQMVKELETMESKVRAKLQELYGLREVIHQCLGRYQAALAEGERLLTEREVFRKRAAADVQDYRYQDMGFRTFRSDAVQKYRATFELAVRYAYLAATAYDYETNLLGSETGSGRAFLTDIVKQRSPGVIMGGKPVVGKRGLADPLARLSQNFTVYKGQLGFNNPQIETNRFSLRRECFRLKDGPDSDLTWQAELNSYVVADLWQIPPFRRFCRPFADETIGPQPGLVIPFSTEVNFGYNFFGWPLGSGDSAYDPSNFATKIRSVGVWFKGYENAGLSSTPRVYLVPVGADCLRTPGGDDFTMRDWHVVDQKLPVPFPVSEDELSEETWIPVHESLSDVLGGIRRFSSFRAFPDADLSGLSESEIIGSQSTTDTRLIGRAVWNTQWLLIIPGGTLLADPDAGLTAFIDNVADIKLFFQTYAYSGN